MPYTKPLAAALAAVSLAGCLTYGDIQALQPIRTETLDGDASVIADCVHAVLIRQPSGFDFVRVKEGEAFHISAHMNDSGVSAYFWDVAVTPAGAQRSTVAVRSHIGELTNAPITPDNLWPIILSCGKQA